MIQLWKDLPIRKILTSKQIKVTERDLLICKRLFEHKVMSRDQIRQRFFPNISIQTVNRRLAKIVKLGLIDRLVLPRRSENSHCYTLTSKGFKTLKYFGLYRFCNEIFKSACPYHDLALVDIRESIIRYKSVSKYLTENVLQAVTESAENLSLDPFINLNSDAMILIKSDKGELRLAIEYDATRKEKKFYGSKLESYYFSPGIDGVLYITATENILKFIKKIDQEITSTTGKRSKFFFASLDEVVTGYSQLSFTSVDGYVFSLS